MKLTNEQINFYHENGYLIMNDVFSAEEVQRLNSDIQNFSKIEASPNIIREKNGAIRSIFAPHKYKESFNALYKQDRLVNAAEQLIGNAVYLYQYKLNNKQALKGEWWEWHQDFPYWNIDDGVKKPDMISVMILLQNTDFIQGPLLIIPGSHKEGVVDFQPKAHLLNMPEGDYANALNSDLKYTVKKELLIKMLDNKKVVIAEGNAGTVVFFHPNVFHSSSSNLSPYDRNTAIITYNDLENLPDPARTRPEFLCSRDFELISTMKSV
jgi:ectoine hydroxylase